MRLTEKLVGSFGREGKSFSTRCKLYCAGVLLIGIAIAAAAQSASVPLAQQPSIEAAGPASLTRSVDVKAIPGLIRNLTEGARVVRKTRVFQFGQVQVEPAVTPTLDPSTAEYDPSRNALLVSGNIGNQPAIEEIRFFREGETLYEAHDLYADAASEDDLFRGRAMPVLLEVADALLQGASELPQTRPLERALALSTMTVAAKPVLTSFGGVTNTTSAGITNGHVDMSCGKRWNGTMVINDSRGVYMWTLFGQNFGSAKGTVTLAGSSAPILSWTNTSIQIDPTVPWYWTPTASSVIAIATSTGQSASFGVDAVPSVQGRIYQQCTWYVAVARKYLGLSPSPSAYGGYQAITSSYVPRVGDQYQWSGRTSTGIALQHTAIVLGVQGPARQNDGNQVYTLSISQYNVGCDNNPSSYSTVFQVKNGSVVKYPQSSVGTLGVSTTFYR